MKMHRMLAVSFCVGTMGCSSPFPCTRYCWSHQQDVPDVIGDEMMGPPNGRFDQSCDTSFGLKPWYPLLPQFGWYDAELCLEANTHEVIAKTVAAIQDPTLDASQACDVTDLQVYADLVQALAMQARDACVDHVTCKGAPAGCDLDPFVAGNQACTVSTAEDLCDQVVLVPALAALSDLTNGPGAAQPQRDGTVIQYVNDPHDCQPLLQADTDDAPACDDPAGGGGVGETSDSGLDDSSGSTGGGFGPFGDIDALVTCTSDGECSVEPELFAHVQHHFAVFYDEGVSLEPITIPSGGVGFQLSGFDRGEASHALLEAFEIEDGDVLTHIDGASLASPATLEPLLLDLPTTTAWRLTLLRHRHSTWQPLERSILRGS